MKKLFAILLAFAVVTGISACGGGGEEDPGNTNIPEGPFGKYEPGITLTSVRDIPNPAVVKYPDGDDVENNVWTRAIKEEMGINVKYEWTVDSSQYATRLNTMMASKQFPDFFYLTASQFQSLVEEGMLADLSGHYDKYGSDDLKRVYTEGGDNAIKSATVDGKLMALPWISMAKEDTQMLWVRTDWLQKLNLKMPETMDELIDVAIAFATRDPDGNGKNDTFGLPVNGDTYGGLMWHKGFFNGYGSYPLAWVENNGKLQYGSTLPGTREALLKLQQMYKRKDNTIELEFINKTYFSLYDKLATGKYGIVYGPYYIAISPLQGVKTRDPKAEWKPVPLLSKKAGEIPKVQTSVDVAGYWVVSKDCKNPEAVIKLMNYWYEKFYFNKDTAIYEKFVNGPEYTGIYLNSPVISYRAWNNLEAYMQVKDVLEGKADKSTLGPIPLDYYNGIKKYQQGDNDSWSAQMCYEAVMNCTRLYKDKNLFMNDMSYFAIDDITAQKFAVLQKNEREVFTKIIIGEYDISKYDQFLSDFDKLGGKEATDAINKWYETQK